MTHLGVYTKNIRHCHNTAHSKVGQNFVVKAMNDTTNENGLVPSPLLFGTVARFPINDSDIPTQVEKSKPRRPHKQK